MPNSSIVNKMVRAAKLDIDLYEEVEADRTATGQAFKVVLISSIAAGLGLVLQLSLFSDNDIDAIDIILALLGGVLSATVMWLVFAWLTYFVGTRFFAGPETSADWGELLRTLGFSTAPGVLRIVPLLNFFVFFWMIVTAVVAVIQALDFTTGRAIGTILVAIIPTLIVQFLVMALLGF